ncbi:hypothetical protein TARUN_7827 [Trichoderma arundinaceum]|uniref:Zinc ribbon domain-containing protein n=1 Tax=Trichoderma arundinaceum TaxID=490622 RepID=A0A395NEP9_TRIAR|nr:hypothetical protein TARUN_7827 [Trichoderma arundinaceum]
MMFNRRRRPVLGAAVLVGASRAAARHEVQRQSVIESQREMDIQREVEAQRRQEEDLERRTQRAVDEAMKKAAAENQPPQQFYNNQPPMPIQAQEAGYLLASSGQPYAPEQFMRAPSPQPPPYLSAPAQNERPKSAQGLSSEAPAMGSNTRFCTQCGGACQVGDRFCSRCGAKQPQEGGELI